MALPSSGSISLNQVNVELGNSGTASINMNSSAVRTLFSVSSGAISMNDGYGASNVPPISISDLSGSRMLSMGGNSSGGTRNTEINYNSIASPSSTASDFGDIAQQAWGTSATTNGSRVVIAVSSTGGSHNRMQYITASSTGNASTFGNLTEYRGNSASATNGTRGIFAGGKIFSSIKNTIDHFTIASTGNSSDFGNLTVSKWQRSGVNSLTGRGVFGGGNSNTNVIDYITISTNGNATDFGDLTAQRHSSSAMHNGTRGCFGGGGNSYLRSIDYITMASTGNASDFGDLGFNRNGRAGTTNGTRGVSIGGFYYPPAASDNTVEYITVATTSNATNHSDIRQPTHYLGASSGT